MKCFSGRFENLAGQAVKAGKYAGSFLEMYSDPLVGILPKQAGS